MENPDSTPVTVSRRDVFKTLFAGAAVVGLSGLTGRLSAAGAASTSSASVAAGESAGFTLPKLPYAYDALEPHIDAQTMEIHHTKHHQAYITAANKALADHTDLRALSAEDLVGRLDRAPAALRTTLRNQAGGHVNHSLFWQVLSPKGGGKPKGEVARQIDATFGGFDAFQQQFSQAAATRFGSGWAWLVAYRGKLEVISTANQDSPLMEEKVPLLGLDVWEHAYYLKYQNRRADYVKAFWNVVNWERVSDALKAAS